MSYQEQQKRLAVSLSEQLSQNTQITAVFTCDAVNESTYQAFSSAVNPFGWVAAYQIDNTESRALAYIPPTVIDSLTHYGLGSRNELPARTRDNFSYSEQFFANEILAAVEEYYSRQKVELQSNRRSSNLSLIHYFYPEEPVIWTQVKTSIHSTPCDAIHICYSTDFFG